MQKKTMASLFSGGGGWDQGGKDAGYKPVFAVEMVPWIARHHASVFGEHVVNASVADVDYNLAPKVTLLCSSPPCQATSRSGAQARSRRGVARDETATVCDPFVGIHTLRAVEAMQPSYVLLENNEGYARSAVFSRIVDGLHGLGYYTDHRVIRAQDYGVPSARERLILRASTSPLRPWPIATGPVSWWQIIGDLVPSMPLDRLAPWQEKGMSDNPPPLGVPLLIGGGNVNRNKRGYIVWRTPDQPSWTIQLAKNTSGMRVVDADGRVRRLSERAIARLMGFPDEYRLPEARGEAITILGNSVPPVLSYLLISAFDPST